jgi:hypothetical protein
MTKAISMGTVWNLWFRVWTGYSLWNDEEGTVDTEDLNYGLLAQFCLETVPHIALQTVNNTLLGSWVSDPIAIASLVLSCFMAMSTSVADGRELCVEEYNAIVSAMPKPEPVGCELTQEECLELVMLGNTDENGGDFSFSKEDLVVNVQNPRLTELMGRLVAHSDHVASDDKFEKEELLLEAQLNSKVYRGQHQSAVLPPVAMDERSSRSGLLDVSLLLSTGAT